MNHTDVSYELNTNFSLHQAAFAVDDFKKIKAQVLNWTKQFSTFCFLDNHQYHIEPQAMECLLAAGVRSSIQATAGNALEQLSAYRQQHTGWLFGHLAYDLKNEMERLHSHHPDGIGFPDLFFFEPAILIRLNEQQMIIEAADPKAVFDQILQHETIIASLPAHVQLENRFSREEYIGVIEQLQQHILRGDCYEINFCQEFFDTHASIDPWSVYQKLSNVSPNPFSALYRLQDQWLICASPERFMRKQGKQLISQPIKGTSRRIHDNAIDDENNKQALQYSAKDRSENVMVVDLVRNDLARICEEATVQVDELYGVYSFPQVHQMISTISGVLRNDCGLTDIIQACFPMGSMTGAPKKRVMELIEQYEKTRRGIFSGALGYIAPNEDFDFNVVIRSIMYHAASGYLSIGAGSGITFYSDAASEWEECMMKVAAMKQVLQ